MERRDFVNKTCKCLLVCAAPVSLLTLSGCEDNNEEPYNNSRGGSINTDLKEIFNLDTNPYTALKTVGNSIVTSGNKVDSSGLILFRKSESEIVCFSRTCTHNGGTISNFIWVVPQKILKGTDRFKLEIHLRIEQDWPK